MTLDALTDPTVAALAAGLGVLMPASVLDEVPGHQYGAASALQDHLQAAGAGGAVSAVDLPELGLVAVNVPEAIAATTGDPDTASRFLRVVRGATDPYTTSTGGRR